MLFTVALVVLAISLIYVYSVWHLNYWIKRNVHGPVPRALVGNFPSFILRHKPVMEDIARIYDEFQSKANFIGVYNGRLPAVFILNNALVKDVLVKNFKQFHNNEFADLFDKDIDPIFGRSPFILKGEEWKEKRAEVTPAFTTLRLKALYPLVEDVTYRMKSYINRNVTSPIETREMCAKFTTDVVSNCIFGADAQSFTKEKAEIREMGRKLLEPSFGMMVMFTVLGLFPVLQKVIKLPFVTKSTEQFFTKMMEDAVQYREKHSIKRVDYLDHLIGLKNKKQISTLDMAAHGVTFFVDGFETSSLAMSFALYELASNPTVQEKLRHELNAARGADGLINYETLLELPYLDQCIHETIRLWPPAALLSKRCTESIELEITPGQNVLIEKEMPIMIPVWSIHRDPKYFEQPLQYNPDRFDSKLGGTKKYRELGCFLPFGDGPRQCLGMRFALMQVKRGVYEIITQYKLSLNSKTKQPLQLDAKQFLTSPAGGLWLDYEPVDA